MRSHAFPPGADEPWFGLHIPSGVQPNRTVGGLGPDMASVASDRCRATVSGGA